ncbi:hypothetical protein AUK04_04895 [Candidatus Roizmanbacteria bacterium CG2_30_33_16]|uniref:Pilus assembly protein PilO n=5 Tax=Candidatus Roizmaniibacteriota TaxID=1752723 RepID=A0A2M7E3T5_9BACT|nr:type 4a pilus biogenesis protein PilO [Candidatus Roizmanbacteria bacterium]OIP82332.1 MAG: hypothetical protein AUK04_04895 [Candidatus Roizmanbacteria bacterium CG2_30_33_16]PIP63980.1 MAG: hypothetical protein COW96_05045 [Candidatus Roizmanbacteria bacterium CG22_combo_CG10-13_8_21_14_all_33_16]PIV62378.1 MAG: hypothetical protein COS12_02635 [Candidatus Roizmanbacteria bacterium CG01_land_8_20_14_3_00_33_9]PIX72356.1 MAG: hypothetical protein COZ39_03145 [Candidatus Roizmanbacteria bact
MDKNNLLKHLFDKKVRDYSSVVVFLIIFSFFIIFIIKPNISLVFQLDKEKNYLDQLDKNYENTIIEIVNLQSEMEKIRQNLDIIDQALPNQVGIDKVVDDLQKSASLSSVSVKKVNFGSFSLIKRTSNKELKKIQFNIDFISNFKNASNYVNSLFKQQRLKGIRQINIDKPLNIATDSSDLNIKLVGEIFYL